MHDATFPAPRSLPNRLDDRRTRPDEDLILLTVKRRVQEPSLLRMSDEWLQAHAIDRDPPD